MSAMKPPVLDVKKSRALALSIGAQNKNCYHNAWNALPLLGDDARYIEGWMAGPIMVTPHAWILWRGKIIDPTPTYFENPREPGAYFIGRSYALAETLDILNKDNMLPIEKAFRVEMNPPDLIEVYRAANEFLYGKETADFIFESMARSGRAK